MPGNVLTATIKVNTPGVKAAFDNTEKGAIKVKTTLKGIGFDDFNQKTKSLASGVNEANLALLNTGRVLQDLPFGIIGVANNINPLLESFQRLKASTGSTGSALKALGSSLIGGGGLGLAVSAVSALATFASIGLQAFSRSAGSAAKAVTGAKSDFEEFKETLDSVSNSIAANVSKVTTLFSALNSDSLNVGQRKTALKELKTINEEFFGSLKDEKGLIDALKSAYDGYISNLLAVGRTKAIESELTRLFSKKLKLELAIDPKFLNATSKDVQEELGSLRRLLEKLGGAVDIKAPNFNPLDKALQRRISLLQRIRELEQGEQRIIDAGDTSEELNKVNLQIKGLTALLGNIGDFGDIKEDKITKKLHSLLDSRLEIIKEFTAKFASIKDPFPDFFTKNLPLGRVEDKALRAALENAFKVLEEASRDLFNTKRIDPGTVPLEIHFKPEIVGKSELVRQIEDKFGDIKKDIEDAVNKGIFIVPIDFKTASEGDGQALKRTEDLVNSLAKSIEGLTGQKDAILDFNFDANNLDLAKTKKIIDDLKERIAEQVSGTPIDASVDANFDVNAKVDFSRLNTQLKTQIADAVNQLQTSLATSIGEAIGNALSGLDGAQDAFAGIMNFLADGIKQIGVALIKIGLLSESIQKALASLSVQPELALALGIAFVALSQVLKNNFSPREKGGPVKKGSLYEVNERGQEIFQTNSGKPYLITGGRQFFTPPVSGKIIPHHQTEKILNSFRTTKINSSRVLNSVNNSVKNFSGYRAGGGAVVAGNNYIVNERGREIFIPNIGQAINVNQPSASVRTSGINVNVTGAMEINGNKLIAVLANAGRTQSRLT